MYREFLIIIFDYVRFLKFNQAVYEIFIPLILSILLFFIEHSVFEEFLKSSITFISILVGFTIAAVAILLTSNLKSIEQSKHVNSSYKDYSGKPVTIFMLYLINFFYCILVGFFIFVFDVVALVFSVKNDIFYAIILFFTIHVLLVIIRNLTNLFLLAYRNL